MALQADSVLRHKRNAHFKNFKTVHCAVIDDARLSWRAKGVHFYLITRPDGWKFHHTVIQSLSKDGRHACRVALDELKQAGYVTIEQERDVNGRFGLLVWTILETLDADDPSPEIATSVESVQDVASDTMPVEDAESLTIGHSDRVAADGNTADGNTVNGETADGNTVDGRSATNKKDVTSCSSRLSNSKDNNKKLAPTAPVDSPKTTKPTGQTTDPVQRDLDIAAVFENWQAVLGYQDRRLTPKRRAAINARLNDGLTVEQLQQVIAYAKADAFLQGDNDRHTKFDDVLNIFRNTDRVERYLTAYRDVRRSAALAAPASPTPGRKF